VEIKLARNPEEPPQQQEEQRESLTTLLIPCVLAWLVPGAGHFYLGRRRRAVFFFVIVLITLALGLWMDGRTYVYDRGHPLTYLATFANVGLGPLDLVGRRMTYDRLVWRLPADRSRTELVEKLREKIRSPLNEYGTTYLMTACLMNILLILDAFDVAKGRKEGTMSPDPAT
jgi:TM2 domain-containing membrane protein YozV